MTIQLEKIFFNYIIQNRHYFEFVEPFYFRNNEIQFIYKIVREYIIDKIGVKMPTVKQIYQMVKLEDKDNNISVDIFKSLFKIKLGDYDEENFIKPKINAWITANRTKSAITDIVDKYRDIDENVDVDKINDTITDIKDTINDMCSTAFMESDKDDGLDFDDPESHIQDLAKYKVKSGFESIDGWLNGGFDVNTLTVFMGETNIGKSIWLENIAFKCADNGNNVLYITLEMSDRKVMKRLGAMRLKIPIDEYDNVSNDVDFIKKKIKGLSKKTDNSGMFTDSGCCNGKIMVKFWAAGTVTVESFDSYISKIENRKNMKFNMIVIDYLTLIALGNGNKNESLYTNGKKLAEKLRALGVKYNCPVVTAIQVSKDAWNAKDISLQNVPESKGIPETADNVFAIIRTDDMKINNKYLLSLLKIRDGDINKPKIRLDLNPTYLTLENDEYAIGI